MHHRRIEHHLPTGLGETLDVADVDENLVGERLQRQGVVEVAVDGYHHQVGATDGLLLTLHGRSGGLDQTHQRAAEGGQG